MQNLVVDDVSPAFLPDSMRSLDPDLRAFSLYGLYMGHFNLMEVGLNEALVKLLNIDGRRGVILTRNITFADKIKTLKCLVSMAFNEAECKRYVSLLNRALKCGEDRNMVAHTPFRASSTTDGVEFFVVKAISKLDFPECDWSVDAVFSRVDEIWKIDNELRELERQAPIRRIAQALLARPEDLLQSQVSSLEKLFSLGASVADEDDPA